MIGKSMKNLLLIAVLLVTLTPPANAGTLLDKAKAAKASNVLAEKSAREQNAKWEYDAAINHIRVDLEFGNDSDWKIEFRENFSKVGTYFKSEGFDVYEDQVFENRIYVSIPKEADAKPVWQTTPSPD